MLIDRGVYDLAEFWLSDDDTTKNRRLHEQRVLSLGKAIQQAIEDWCEDDADERTKGDDDGKEYGHPREALEECD